MSVQEVGGVPKEKPFDPFPLFLEQVNQERRSRTSYNIAKRSLDLVISLIALIAFAPVMIVIAIAIKSTSKGPVLFRQERIGAGGKSFTFVKFRTMKHKADDSIHKQYVQQLIHGTASSQSDNPDKPMFKLRDDPRITRIGHFLRKTSLDEIPQLFNVIQGSMSLVGPRPPISYEVNAYKSWHMKRLSVKPGITGLWQVSGRSTTTFDEMVHLDIEYIDNRSVSLDMKILFQTIPAALDLRTAA